MHQPTLAGHTHVKLKNYVYFGLTAAGVVFDAGNRSFILKGASMYPLVSRLIALLDEGRSLASIFERTPDKLATVFRTVLASLDEHDMLLPVHSEHPSPTALAPHEANHELYKVLEDRLPVGEAPAAMTRWGTSAVVLMGSGWSLQAAAGALLDTGCRSLSIFQDPQAAPCLQVEALRARLQQHGEPGPVLRCEADYPDVAVLDTAALVLYVSDVADLAAVRNLERWLRETGTPGIIAATLASHACVLPSLWPGDPGITDLLHWLPAVPADAPSHGPMSMAVMGCVAAQAGLLRFFNIDQDKRRGMVAVVDPGLAVGHHCLVNATASRATQQPFVHASKYEKSDGRVRERFEMFRLALEPWFDPLLGPLGMATDDSIRQMPLLQYPLLVRGAHAAGSSQLAVGWGLELGDAGVRAMSAAVELFAVPFAPYGVHIAAGIDEEATWHRAFALAIVASGAFTAQHSHADIDLGNITDPQVKLLARLLRYHTGGTVRAQLLWSTLGHARAVRIWIDQRFISAAVAEDGTNALIDALGKACSAFQLAQVEANFWAHRAPVLPPVASGTAGYWQDGFVTPTGASAPGASFVSLCVMGLPPQVHCGYAQFKAPQP